MMARPDRSTESATLESLCDRLDLVISLLMPAAVRNSDQPKGLALDILKLCDYDHTTEDIRKAVNKTATHVLKELSLLRSKGMIRTVQRNGRQVHVRLP
jgi:hypothetical protein